MKRASLLFLCFVAALLAAPVASSASEPRLLLLLAKEQLADQKFGKAEATLQGLLAKAPPEAIADEAVLLAARAELLGGKAEASARRLGGFLEARAESRFQRRARHLLAEAYVKLKRFKDAAAITQAQLDIVSGRAWRERLGGLYIELADEAWEGELKEGLAPGRKLRVRDWGRAASLYEMGLRYELPSKQMVRSRLRQAECYAGLGRTASASSIYGQILRALKDQPKHPALPKVRLLRARSLMLLGKMSEARELLRAVEKQSPHFAADAIEGLGMSYRPGRSRSEAEARSGIEHWQRLLRSHPESAAARRVKLVLAAAYDQRGRNSEAVAAYRLALKTKLKEAEAGRVRVRIGDCLERLERFADSRAAFALFLGEHPSHALFPKVQERIAESWIREGRAAAARKGAGAVKDAVAAWRSFLERYPVHPKAAEVQLGIASLYAGRKLWDEALGEWRKLARSYDGRRPGARAQLALARCLEQQRNDLPGAIKAYQRLTERFSRWGEARRGAAALQVMRNRRLSLSSPRSFHSGEKLSLRLVTRNIPMLRMKAWRLDLVEYFKTQHGEEGLVGLDVGLVAPDQQWSQKTPGYRDYQRITTDLPLPAALAKQGLGAWVVRAETDEWVATTVVLVTDLECVVKRGEDQVLVFVKDRLSGKPAAGVELLAARKDELKELGKTGADGVLKTALKGKGAALLLRQGSSVTVAEAAVLKRSRLSFSGSLESRGYVYSDRPLYRPGESVHYRAVIRVAEKGAMVNPAGRRATLKIVDPSGKMLVSREIKMSAFGTYAGTLELSEEAGLGEYQVAISLGQEDFAGAFNVAEYEKPKVLVTVQSARRDALSGEAVEFVVEARHYEGGPVANASLEWTVESQEESFDESAHRRFSWFLGAGRETPTTSGHELKSGSAKTDAKGRFVLRFDAETVDYDARYSMAVELEGADGVWARGSGSALVPQRGFHALVTAESEVLRPGQELRVSVETVGADHSPRSAAGELRVLRRNAAGKGEVLVETQLLRTGQDGKAGVTLTLAQSGEYELRFVGKDRRGAGVEASAAVSCVGESEDLAKDAKLRAGKEVYRHGETAKVLVNSPKAGTWALLTFEGTQVLDHRVVWLAKRSNLLGLPMKELYAPNVRVAVSLLSGDRLYEAHDEVLVLRYLDVEIKPTKAVAAPDESIEVELIVRDQSGKPVQSELSLGVVDEKIYALSPEPMKGMKPFFYDRRRGHQVRTTSSASWGNPGHTRAQEQALVEARKSDEREGKLAELRGRLSAALEMDRFKGLRPRKAHLLKEKAKRSGWGKDRGEQKKAEEKSPKNENADKKPAAGGVFSFGDEDEESAGGVEALVAAEMRASFRDTAHWSPAIETDAAGRARVKIALPGNLTTWRLTVRGIDRRNLVGDGRATVLATKPVVADLSTPRFLVAGDQISLEAASRNRSGKKCLGRFAVTAKGLAIDATVAMERKTLGPGAERRELLRASPTRSTGEAKIELRYESTVASDGLVRKLPILPFGKPVRQAFSGLLGEAVDLDIELGLDRVPGTAALEIQLSTGADSALLEALAALEASAAGGVESTASRFFALSSARGILERMGTPAEEVKRRCERVIGGGIARLRDMELEEGGWTWWGSRKVQDGSRESLMGSYALMALELARAGGAQVDPSLLRRSRRWLTDAFEGASSLDESAFMLYALSLSERADSDHFSRAIRLRNELSSQGLALLALACMRIEEGPSPAPVLALLKRRALVKDGLASWSGGERGWFGSSVEATAWAGLAFLEQDPDYALVDMAARSLLARQRSGLWSGTKESAVAALFLARYAAKRKAERTAGELSLELDGKLVASAQYGGDKSGARRILLGDGELKPGKHRLRILRKGGGKLRYAAELRYLARTDRIPGTTRGPLRLSARLARLVDKDGTSPLPGWDIVQPDSRPAAASLGSISEVARGQLIEVTLSIESREELRFVRLEAPLPAGCEPDGEFRRLAKAYDRRRRRDDRLEFFLSRLPAGLTTIRYQLRAVSAGRFRLRPARVSAVYAPELNAHSADARLRIFGPGESAKMKIELTPDERLELARRAAEKKRWTSARSQYVALRKEFSLRPTVEIALLKELFRVAAKLGDAALIVESYEALSQLDPSWRGRLGRRDRRRLVDAYAKTGEHLRAYNLGRDLLMSFFAQEARLVEVERKLGRQLEAQSRLESMLLSYPETPRIIEEWFDLARRYESIRRPAKDGAPRLPLHEKAYEGLKDFCALFPGSKLAGRAQLLAARALGAIGDHEGADREALTLLDRDIDTRLEESALLLLLRSGMKRKNWDGVAKAGEALLRLRHVKDGRSIPSRYRAEVWYSLGRLHHIRGQLPKAVAAYAKVRKQYPDADAAWRYLTEAGVVLPSQLLLRPGEEAAVELGVKNLGEVRVRAYAVDLMRLFLMRKSLRDIHRVRLTGIKPMVEERVKLGATERFAWRKRKIRLPVKKAGVYLVTAKAGEHERSSLVLMSELRLEIQRRRGQVRIYAFRGDKPAAGVLVRCADGRSIISSGKTDARGLFASPGVALGRLAVVAQAGEHYALFDESRGE